MKTIISFLITSIFTFAYASQNNNTTTDSTFLVTKDNAYQHGLNFKRIIEAIRVEHPSSNPGVVVVTVNSEAQTVNLTDLGNCTVTVNVNDVANAQPNWTEY